MKKLIFLPAILFSQLAQAVAPVIAASGTSPVAYQEYLQKNPHFISYSDYIHENLQRNSFQEQKLFKLGDSFDVNLDWTLISLKGLQQEAPLTLNSLRFLRDLSEKALTKKLPTTEVKHLRHSLCKATTLLNEGPAPDFCQLEIINPREVAKKFPQYDRIIIESVRYSMLTDSIPLAAQTAYHWTLTSDWAEPFHFYGTYGQLLQQSQSPVSSIEGNCEHFTVNAEKFNHLNPAHIFFSEQCQKLSHELPEEKSWVEKNRTWLMVAGSAALGFLAYSAMKDKTLVLNKGAL